MNGIWSFFSFRKVRRAKGGSFCRESPVDGIAAPETCVRWLRMASVKNYSRLWKGISGSEPAWIVDFLELGGLQVLFESVDRLSASNNRERLQAVRCLRAILHSQTALQHVVRKKTSPQTISQMLSSPNPLVKRQLFDFLSTLCIFSEEGHYLTLDAFECLRERSGTRCRFAVLLDEMKRAELASYIAGVLQLVNCIILGAAPFHFRTRLRNEFIAVGVSDFLGCLEWVESEEVRVQCSVFRKSQSADEEHARSVGLTAAFSHLALFQALLHKIEDTPLAASFLLLLDNLNRLDPLDSNTDVVWRALEERSRRTFGRETKACQTEACQTEACQEEEECESVQSGIPPPPPPPPPITAHRSHTMPMPKAKMRTLHWAKIPTIHLSVHSIWNEIHRESETIELNFDEMEKLFCQSEARPKVQPRKRAPIEVSLIDSKRCLSIGVFLKQFKGGVEEVIEKVQHLQSKAIGAERLRTLLHLLPDSKEIQVLRAYDGSLKELGPAERFLARLLAVERYDCLIEGMLLLEEYPTTFNNLHHSVQSLLEACKHLLANQGLKKFLRLVLVTGNFMNTGSYAGNAMGFRLSTLPKLLETRANKPRMTLLHYLVEEMKSKYPDGIHFADQLLHKLSLCSRLTRENLSAEMTELDETMQKLNSKIKAENGQLKIYFAHFTQEGLKHLAILKRKMKEINEIAVELAKRFSEDESKFQLEECLNVISLLCRKIKIVDSENQAYQKLDEKKT